MKLKAATKITLTLFLASILIAAFDVANSADEPPVHNIDTSLDYETIQEAIDASETSDGHTIRVDAGSYFEHVTVDKSVKLVGEDISNTIIDGSKTGTVVVVKANNVDISGFTIRNSGLDAEGINLDNSSNTVIGGNIVTNNEWGIWLDYSVNNVIRENTIQNSTYGSLYLGDSNNNSIIGNTLSGNRYGMWLERSSENNVIGTNTVIGNSKGIALAKTTNNNTISDNTLTNNDDGIYLFSSFNNIYENTMTNNLHGIYSSYSGSNVIYRNNFIENTEKQASNESLVDVWDNGAEGNYWSDYNGEDLNGDGVGDTLRPHQGLDQYPLMEPWSQFRAFDVIWEEGRYRVTTFSNSTIASFNFNASLKQISFNVTGPSGAAGFCNVTVPKSLLRDPWLILLEGANVTASTVIVETGTHTFFYLSYDFSTHKVTIIGTDVLDTIPPVANAGPDQTVEEDTLVTFNGSLSYDNIGITNYTWTFLDETPQTLTGVNPTYTFANPGTYTVTLTVKDAASNTNTDSITVTVLSQLQTFPWWIAGTVALVGIAVAGLILWKRKTKKNVT